MTLRAVVPSGFILSVECTARVAGGTCEAARSTGPDTSRAVGGIPQARDSHPPGSEFRWQQDCKQELLQEMRDVIFFRGAEK